MEITKEVALNILQSRSVVSEPGKYTVKVTSVNPFTRDNEDGSQTNTHIVNFNCMTQFQASQATKAFKEADYESAINSTSMTASQLSGQYVPSKGETVDIEVRTHLNKDGVEILVVDSIIARKAVTSKKFSLVLEEEPVEEEIA